MKDVRKRLMGILLLMASALPCLHARVNNTVAIADDDDEASVARKAAHLHPTGNQLSALRDEFIAFIHFGPNTFTRREWGDGMESPSVFALKKLDTDQWCGTMKVAGMKKVLLTVKHHDGFVLWQSRYTRHGIMLSPFESGQGDILKSLSVSCRKYGLKLGIYLSPADLYQIESPEGLYGNGSAYTERTIPRKIPGRPFRNKTTFRFCVDDYNEYFLNQLFELLTEYGPIHEVWFDGAHPKRKGGQRYNYAAWKTLIRRLAPKAVIFGREDIRWCGNEAGRTRSTEWNVVGYPFNPDTASVFYDMTDADLGSRSVLAAAKYLHYQPAETNTSIRDGWFYRDDDYQYVRSADDVFDIYERSVGGNSTFLLNIPPNREGRFSEADVKVLREVGRHIRETYADNLLAGGDGSRKILDNDDETCLVGVEPITVALRKPALINRIVLQEDIARHGERVEKHVVEALVDGRWREVARSTNIGYKRILRFPAVVVEAVRLRVLSWRDIPAISTMSACYYPERPPRLVCRRTLDGNVTIGPKEQSCENVSDYRIYYTMDGSEPSAANGILYVGSFPLDAARLRAVAVNQNGVGEVMEHRFGFIKKDWRVLDCTSEDAQAVCKQAFDENDNTGWQAMAALPQTVELDLGRDCVLNGLACTPMRGKAEGMATKGCVYVSNDTHNWEKAGDFSFGNVINDPSRRFYYFASPLHARYVRVKFLETACREKLAMAELDFF